MKDELKRLYKDIKEGRLTNREAAKQLKSMVAGMNSDQSPPQDLEDEIELYLKKILSSVIKLSEDRFESDAPLEKYGLDSIMIVQLTDELEKDFGSLSKTLFFEYQTIQQLAEYFMNSHQDRVSELFANRKQSETRTAAANEKSQFFKQHPLQNLLQKGAKQRPSQAFVMEGAKSNAPAAHSTSGTPFSMDIAIIGLAGRYPGAPEISDYWRNLRDGKDSITEIPADRWDCGAHIDRYDGGEGRSPGKWGGFIDGVDQFDPLFFNISPREAEMMDPQERLFLECVYHAIEDAGYTRDTLVGEQERDTLRKIGVYVGVMYEEYQLYGAEAQAAGKPFAVGGSPASIANRVSYFGNFQGPSVAVDTMCSSSLSALHFACQSLRMNECEVAIAGGVNLSIHPNKYLLLSQGNFLSSKGRCESFGEGGDGYVPGEGVGAVLLKPLDRAVQDGDHIYGIIKGTAINHGGKTNGYTVPNPRAQAGVIAKALKEANVNPRTVSYLEAHGTGTSLGDPIEIAGLCRAFQEFTPDRQFCAIGSAKSNIGHCESAAGIAGLTKVLLQLKHRKLVPSLHSAALNPKIDFSATPFTVQHELADWERPTIEINGSFREYPRIAGLSSFGAGGSNAHVIIEEYLPEAATTSATPEGIHEPALVLLSAKNEDRLNVQAEQLLAAIREQMYTDADLRDIAFTLQIGREAMDERLAIIAWSIQDLEAKLAGWLRADKEIRDVFRGQVKRNRETMALFGDDEDMQETIGKWIDRRKYNKLLGMWVKGLRVDWHKLYRANLPCRISLPTYPFTRSRFWIPEWKDAGERKLTSNVMFQESAASCILEKTWTVSAVFQQTSPTLPSGLAVVLANEETRNLAAYIFRGAEVTPLVIRDDKSLQITGDDWTMDFSDPEHAEYVLHHVMERTSPCVGLLDLSDWHAGPLFPERRKRGKIALLQGLIRNHYNTGLAVLHITKGLQAWNSREVTLAGADFAGFIRMLGAEYRNIHSTTVDVDFVPGDEIRDTIWQEWRQENNEVCYRQGVRYIPQMTSVNAAPSARQFAAASDRWIIVTGGTRGIGYETAAHLLDQGCKKLALMGIQPIPPREAWNQPGADPALLQRVQAIRDLEEKGAEVKWHSGKLTDEYALNAFFDTLRENGEGIGGVIHCAGLMDLRSPAFIRKTPEEITAVLEPKVDGLCTLHRCLEGDKLEFFLLFSSVSGTVPALASGVSDYAAANAYMDYFATYQHRLGNTYYQSIQWPNWGETGLGVTRSETYNQLGFTAHRTSDGLSLLDACLRFENLASLMPCIVRHNVFRPEALLTIPARIQAGTATARTNVPPTAASPSKSEDRDAAALAWLRGIFSKQLKIAETELDEDTPFGEFGVDSILMVDLVKQIEACTGRPQDPSLFLEFPTLRTLSEQLQDHMPRNADEEASNPVAESAWSGSQSTARSTSMPAMGRAIRAKVKKRKGRNAAESAASSSNSGKIAVIGMACRFPGAGNKEEFWDNLLQGHSGITEVPITRWDKEHYYAPHYEPGKSISKWGGFINDIEYFDAKYFHISAEEAPYVDPLIRQFLEISVQTVRDAGYDSDMLWGQDVGVFVGSRAGAFAPKLKHLTKDSIIGVGQNFIAAHVSHHFNWKGPNLVVDTACSSSLVSLHLACQSLLNGESGIALAGGVDILLDEVPYLVLSEARALSPDGKCHTFDSKANGFVPGEGCGAIMLKRLEDAIDCGDRIYAVIEATSVNNDGRTMGITTPNPEAQISVIESALRKGRIRQESISYVETHGTGTMIGDPIELRALTKVFRKSTAEKQFCGVGSVKSNIGHLLSAAGIASFIKVALSLHHGQLPPTLNCETPNPRFDFNESPFYPNVRAKRWEAREGIRRAGISSFGFGGTNAHVIMRDAAGSEFADYRPTRSPLAPVEFQRERVWGIDDSGHTVQPVITASRDHLYRPLMQIVDEL
ncbi:Putative mixed polyketide synthase/non-ribosomal peptide synthetase (fragment) [Paenibacillus alvei]|uniref:Mixed polyketide synthase/non-ribosomal peptide synthetase n=1 Tax=Paenibacillus alvei TaxID=44250 RepID=A0A383R9U4_PAEAL